MKLLISSICIILAFSFGYSFAEQKNKQLLKSYESIDDFVNISIKKNKLSINKTDQNIEVLVNGETLFGEMTLENICY